MTANILIEPSEQCHKYINNLDLNCNLNTNSDYLMNDGDWDFIKSLNLENVPNSDISINYLKDAPPSKSLLTVDHLKILYTYFREQNCTIYIHELLKDSRILLLNRNDYFKYSLYEKTSKLFKPVRAIGKFIFSVIGAFLFGFLGVDFVIGRLDFGFRLLLGIICSLTFALADLYNLAEKLNED